VDGIDVSFGRGAGARQILHDLSLTVGRGESVGLVGETGSGKTTLARAILGLVPTTDGAITVGSTVVTGLGRRALRSFRRTGRLQYVFQDPLQSLDPDVTVGESVAEGLRIRDGGSVARHRDAVDDAMRAVGLEHALAGRRPGELSGGQRQRIAIARALVLDPELLLLDEPVSGLDAANRIHVLELLKRLGAERGIAQLFISHDLGSVAGITDRVAVLYRGRIVETGPTAQIVRAPQHAYTQLLIGSAPTLSRGGVDRERRRELRQAHADSLRS
jgi:peptide/nickel transport system ATP-binding protein